MVETDVVVMVVSVSVIVGNGIMVPCDGIDEQVKGGV